MPQRATLFDRVVRELVALTLNESTNGQNTVTEGAAAGTRSRGTGRVTGE